LDMTKLGTDLDRAAQLLAAGGLVAIPTETVYGLAANGLDEMAVLRIFKAKRRPLFDPLILHTSSVEKARRWVSEMPTWAEELAAAWWPGPLTLLLPKMPEVPDLVTSGLPHAAVRVPRHTLTLELLESLPFPVAAPSANPFGYVSPTRPEHVAAQLLDEVDYILDGGPCEVGIESTIVGYENGQVTIFRTGGLPVEEIERVVGKVAVRQGSTSNPVAPGMLKSHYAPGKPVLFGMAKTYFSNEHADRSQVGVISLRNSYPVPSEHQRVLSPEGNLDEAARNLFKAMRELDATSVRKIVTEEFPDSFLGRAINERLRRASAPRD
jgi:L-threonylcarbamoyladenylate synthase